jgi:hypothetical protein
MVRNIFDTTRDFERKFREIAAAEARHLKTTLAEGRCAADQERRDREEFGGSLDSKPGEVVESVTYDFVNGKVTFEKINQPNQTEGEIE